MVVWEVWVWCVGWAWWAAEAGVAGCGLAALGLLVTWGSWELGRWLDERWSWSWDWSLWWPCWRAGMVIHAWDLHLARPGPPRLAALRRLACWLATLQLQRPGRRTFMSCYHYDLFPDLLVDSLFECLLESGAEAARILIRLSTDTLYFAIRLSGAPVRPSCRERLFSKASLARLRAFFLASVDGAVQRAFLTLYHYASRHVLMDREFSDSWNPLVHDQVGRNQEFLLHEPFARKVLGLLRGGDPAGLLPAATCLYAELEGGIPPSNDRYSFSHRWQDFGLLALLRPVMGDLARSFDRLSDVSKAALKSTVDEYFFLCPVKRPAEAVETLEGRLVPLLRGAASLSPAGLYWLVTLFSSRDGWPASQLGRRLRASVHGAVGEALGEGTLSPAQSWALVTGVAKCYAPTWDGDRKFCEALRWRLYRLPVAAETRLLACRAFQLLKEELRRTLGWAGGFGLIRRLARLHHAPDKEWNHELSNALSDACRLLQPVQPPETLDVMEARKILVAWRESEVEAALREVCAQPPPPASYADPRGNASWTLGLADGLLRDPPLPFRSTFAPGAEILFPLH